MFLLLIACVGKRWGLKLVGAAVLCIAVSLAGCRSYDDVVSAIGGPQYQDYRYNSHMIFDSQWAWRAGNDAESYGRAAWPESPEDLKTVRSEQVIIYDDYLDWTQYSSGNVARDWMRRRLYGHRTGVLVR